jgi:hypothetical protein
MDQQIKRVDVVPSGIVVVFEDQREAIIQSDELLAIAQLLRAFERAEAFQGKYEEIDPKHLNS